MILQILPADLMAFLKSLKFRLPFGYLKGYIGWLL